MVAKLLIEDHEYCDYCGDCIVCETDHYCKNCKRCRWNVSCRCELEAGDESPQLEPENDAGDSHSRAAEGRDLRPAVSQQSQWLPDYHDVGFHIMQPVVSRFTEFVHLVMKASHLLRETLLPGQRRINTLAVAVDARVQTLHRRHHIAEGGTTTVGGLPGGRRLLAWGHDIIIMPCGQELGKELGR